MAPLRTLLSKVTGLFRKAKLEQQLDEDVRAHIEMLTGENLRKGMDPEEARYAALRQFGNVSSMKEECREIWSIRIIEELVQDVRYGLRQLRRNPGFTAVAVLTLALGIGANTAIFSIVNAVQLRPLPYPHSNRLVWITEYVSVLKAYIASGADYVDWKQQNKTLDGITAYDESASFNLTGRGTPARVQGAQVSASFFPTLDVQPELGRGFTREEDQPNGPHVVVLMHSFWQQYFGSDPRVLGETINLDAAAYTIIGVMPARFKFPGNSEAQLLVPLQLNEAHELLRQMMRMVHIIGRLKPGVPVASAQDDLGTILKRAESAVTVRPNPEKPAGPNPLAGEDSRGASASAPKMMMQFQWSNAPAQAAPTAGKGSRRGAFQSLSREDGTPHAATKLPRQSISVPQRLPPSNVNLLPQRFFPPPQTEVLVVRLAEHLAGNLRPAMLIMLGVVGLVLLIACANVANLMLARASTRERELAVRGALGAGRGRLVRQLLTESGILALAGGLAGLALSAWGVRVLARLIPSSMGGGILSLDPPHVDETVLLFALAVSVVTGVLFGLAPAITSTHRSLIERLKEGSQFSRTRAVRGWLRGSLAVVELSLALMVLIGAGLLMKSFYRMLSVNLGFAPQHLLTVSIDLTDAHYPKPAQKRAFFSEVLRRSESLPGVRSAALADSLPLSPFRARLMITPPWLVPSAGSPPGSNAVQMNRLAISPSYFFTLGIPLLEGRTFTDGDNERAPYVAVINEALARRLCPGQDPVGKQMPLFGGPLNTTMTIVGVVGNTRHQGPSASVESEIYVPFLQSPSGMMQLAVRTTADPTRLAGEVRRLVAVVDPEQPIAQMTTVEQTLSRSVAPQRFNMLILGIFALIALALSAVGIYGVISYGVEQRTHEIGVRMALGAERSQVLRLVIGQGLKLALIGVAIGIAGALALTRFLASLLYGVTPNDPFTFIAVSLVLVAVALLACYIPARRAAKVDPMVALRYE